MLRSEGSFDYRLCASWLFAGFFFVCLFVLGKYKMFFFCCGASRGSFWMFQVSFQKQWCLTCIWLSSRCPSESAWTRHQINLRTEHDEKTFLTCLHMSPGSAFLTDYFPTSSLKLDNADPLPQSNNLRHGERWEFTMSLQMNADRWFGEKWLKSLLPESSLCGLKF